MHPRGGGGSGEIELDFAGDDTVLFRCVAGGSPPPPPPPTSSVVINEIDYDQVGADGDGFVELENTGTTAVDLAGLALVFVDGTDSEEYRREALTGTLAPGGYLVVAGDAQNGAPDGIALVDTATEPSSTLSPTRVRSQPRSSTAGRTRSSRARCSPPRWRTRTPPQAR